MGQRVLLLCRRDKPAAEIEPDQVTASKRYPDQYVPLWKGCHHAGHTGTQPMDGAT